MVQVPVGFPLLRCRAGCQPSRDAAVPRRGELGRKHGAGPRSTALLAAVMLWCFGFLLLNVTRRER